MGISASGTGSGTKSIKKRSYFLKGMKDAVPVGLGYFAVSFSLGIAAGAADFTVAQSALLSLLNLSSSGQYAGLVLTREHAGIVELILMILIANARYLLMSCALSQRLDPEMPFRHRFLLGYGVTDEIFGLEIASQGYVSPSYVYGMYLTSVPGWVIGTALGTFMGNIMPTVVAEALNVAIYGMFLAIIVPPSKENHTALGFVALAFVSSGLASVIPVVRDISSGTRTLVLTVLISAAAAALFPVRDTKQCNA